MSLHSRTVRTARAASDPYLWGQNGATEQTFIMIKPDAVGTPWATTRLALQCHEMSRFHPGSRAGLVVEQPRPGAEESFAALR